MRVSTMYNNNMEKIASDAFSQGAYEALQQMDVPGYIKQAAASYLFESGGVGIKTAENMTPINEDEAFLNSGPSAEDDWSWRSPFGGSQADEFARDMRGELEWEQTLNENNAELRRQEAEEIAAFQAEQARLEAEEIAAFQAEQARLEAEDQARDLREAPAIAAMDEAAAQLNTPGREYPGMSVENENSMWSDIFASDERGYEERHKKNLEAEAAQSAEDAERMGYGDDYWDARVNSGTNTLRNYGGAGAGVLGLGSIAGAVGSSGAKAKLRRAGFSEGEVDNVLSTSGGALRGAGKTLGYGALGGGLGYGAGLLADKYIGGDESYAGIGAGVGAGLGAATGAYRGYAGEGERAADAIAARKDLL